MPRPPEQPSSATARWASSSRAVRPDPHLVRAEVELAKAELAEKGKQAGIGASMFGGAGVFGLFGFGALTTAIIALLATTIATWVAA